VFILSSLSPCSLLKLSFKMCNFIIADSDLLTTLFCSMWIKASTLSDDDVSVSKNDDVNDRIDGTTEH